MYKIKVKILAATIEVASNRKELLPPLTPQVEVKSLLTDFFNIQKIESEAETDGYIVIEEAEGSPAIIPKEKGFFFKGPFLRMSQEAPDQRFTFWGNQGFLYRYTLYLLEKNHRIFNFHACALYHQQKNSLYLIVGGAGSGKTAFLLRGLEKGLKLFSTETAHFQHQGQDLTWFMGSLVDNVRLGTLVHDFPRFLPQKDPLQPEGLWQKKVAVDLSAYRTGSQEIRNPREVAILFPHIEERRNGFEIQPVTDRKTAAKMLFDNISQKISETVVLYDLLPVVGLDEASLARKRLESVNQLVKHDSIRLVATVLSNPQDCWGSLLENNL